MPASVRQDLSVRKAAPVAVTLLISTILLIGTHVHESKGIERHSQPALQSPVAVPARFQFAEAFVRRLEAAGLAVYSVESCTCEAMIRNVRTAVLIRTARGALDVIVFPNRDDAEQLTISYEKDGPSRHRYKIYNSQSNLAAIGNIWANGNRIPPKWWRRRRQIEDNQSRGTFLAVTAHKPLQGP
jgi:hypothetical protein